MNDLVIILEYILELIFIGFKSKKFTFYFTLLFSILIIYFNNIKLIYKNSAVNLLENDLIKLIIIGLIIFTYKYNNIISILLFLFLTINIGSKKKSLQNYHEIDKDYLI